MYNCGKNMRTLFLLYLKNHPNSECYGAIKNKSFSLPRQNQSVVCLCETQFMRAKSCLHISAAYGVNYLGRDVKLPYNEMIYKSNCSSTGSKLDISNTPT